MAAWSVKAADDELEEGGGWASSIVRTDDNPLCVCFVKSRDETAGMEIITGQQCGDIYTWSYGKVVSKVKGAHKDGVTQV